MVTASATTAPPAGQDGAQITPWRPATSSETGRVTTTAPSAGSSARQSNSGNTSPVNTASPPAPSRPGSPAVMASR